jgi:hypothetical protein
MIACFITALLAASISIQADEPLRIGIRLQAPRNMPQALIKAMMRETERHWRFPGLRLHWHDVKKPCDGMDHRLVVVEMRGGCTLHRFPGGQEVKPLGYTHMSDGHVLPFIEIDCAAVSASVSRVTPELSAFLNRDVYARALAAVLTHEMIHALTESKTHVECGVMQQHLTPRELTEPDLSIAPETIDELEEALGVPLASSSSH